MNFDLSYNVIYAYLFGTCFIGFVYGIINWCQVNSINIKETINEEQQPNRKSLGAHIEKMEQTSQKIQSVI